MRHSPARAHYQQTLAAQAPSEDRPMDRAAVNAYELMLLKLAEDKRRLKDIQSLERKADVKRELLPEYAAWIDGVLAGDSGLQDDVFMTVLVWTIDIGDIERAIPLAAYAIRHDLAMPDQYKRTPACLIAEETADIALKGIAVAAPLLQAVAALTDGHDMPDEVRAKLHKAIGYALRDAGQLVEARDRLAHALALHDKVGVKKDIERLDTAIKNSAPAPGGEG